MIDLFGPITSTALSIPSTIKVFQDGQKLFNDYEIRWRVNLLDHLRRSLYFEANRIPRPLFQRRNEPGPFENNEDSCSLLDLKRLNELENAKFFQRRMKRFCSPYSGTLRAEINPTELSFVHSKNLEAGPPLRVLSPSIHPAAAAAFLHMRESLGFSFDVLDFSGRLGIEVLSLLRAKDFDFVIVAESPVMLWGASSIFESMNFVGRVTESQNKILIRKESNHSNIKHAFFQSGTTGHHHLRINGPNGINAESVRGNSLQIHKTLDQLDPRVAISLVHHHANAYLSSGNFKEAFDRFPSQVSIFVSIESDYFKHPHLLRSFLEVYYHSLFSLRTTPRSGLMQLSACAEFMSEFSKSFFEATEFIQI